MMGSILVKKKEMHVVHTVPACQHHGKATLTVLKFLTSQIAILRLLFWSSMVPLSYGIRHFVDSVLPILRHVDEIRLAER